MYQGAVLQRFSASIKASCKENALDDLKRLNETMRNRLEWSDVQLLRAILVVLDTQNWLHRQKSEDGSGNDSEEEDSGLAEVKSALEIVTTFFRVPLEAKGAHLSSLLDEIQEVVEYSRMYLSIEKESYKRVWYRLHSAPDAAKWPNILLICELLFSLPFSNGKVERFFSSLKVIKTERRTSLHVSTVDDLLEITTEGPPLSHFTPDSAVDLWWSDCKTTQRVNQQPQKLYRKFKPSTTTPDSDSSSEEEKESAMSLEDWHNWFPSRDPFAN